MENEKYNHFEKIMRKFFSVYNKCQKKKLNYCKDREP